MVMREITDKQVEEMLATERTFLSVVLENVDAGIVACNEKGELVLFNRAARDWHGLDPLSIPQEEWAEHYDLYMEDGITPMNINTVPLARAFRGEKLHDIGMVISAKGQPKRDILANASPIKGDDGRILGAVAVMHDITDRKRAEEARNLLVAIVEGSDDAILSKDLGGYVLSWNKAAEQMYGYEAKEIISKHISLLLPPEEKDAIDRIIEQIKHGRKVSHFETERIRKDGGRVWVSLSISPLQDSKGVINGASIIARDITDRKRLEMELVKAKEEEFRAVFDNAVDGIVIVNIESKKFYRGNKSFCRMLDYSPEEIKNLGVMDIHPQKDLPYVISQFEGQAKGEITLAEDLPVKRKDGSIFYADVNAAPITIAGKMYLMGFFRDTTERKRAEEMLRESEDRYRSLFVSSRDAIMTLEPPMWRFTSGNPATVEMFRVKDEAVFLTYEPWRLSPEYQPDGRASDEKAREMIETAMREGSHFFEWIHKRADGEEFSANVLLSRVEQREKIFLQAIVRDITEIKKNEEELKQHRENLEKLVEERTVELKHTVGALRASEVRYRRLFETAKDGILILDAETGKIVDVNPYLVEMLGFSHEQFAGKAIWEIGLFKDIASNKNKFMELQQKEYVRYKDLPLETAGGKQIDVEFVSNVYTVDSHKVIQCNIRDITERKQLERELKGNAEIKSQFTSMVSHELRSPLGVIKEGINIVLEGLAGGINDEQRDLLDTAKRNTDRLGRLINNVLDFQKMDSGRMGFDIRENDINEVVLEVNKAMSLTAKQKGLDLVAVTDNGIPRTEFDRDKIVQVLTNLVSNAIKYTEKGNVTIGTRQEDNMVHVTVQDTGIGIRAEDMQRLFRAFERVDGEKRGGTGLGLAISKEIILAHQGKTWAESEPGKGSIFHFTIPKKLEGKKKIGEILVEEGKIGEGDLKKALEKQEKQE